MEKCADVVACENGEVGAMSEQLKNKQKIGFASKNISFLPSPQCICGKIQLQAGSGEFIHYAAGTYPGLRLSAEMLARLARHGSGTIKILSNNSLRCCRT